MTVKRSKSAAAFSLVEVMAAMVIRATAALDYRGRRLYDGGGKGFFAFNAIYYLK